MVKERVIAGLANHYYDGNGKSRIHGQLPERKVSKLVLPAHEQDRRIETGKQRFQEIRTLYPHAEQLERSTVERDLQFVEPGVFAKPQHAIKPYHEARHMNAVYLFGELLVVTAEAMQQEKPDAYRVPVDREALKMATRTHDVTRFFPRSLEWLESIHVVNQLHGKVAEAVMPRWFKDADRSTVAMAQHAVSYHDLDKTPAGLQNPTLELLVVADRLELSRLLNDRFYGRRSNPLRKQFEKRANEYNAVFFPELRDLFAPVADGLYLLTVQKLNALVDEGKKTGRKVSFAEQQKAFLDAAEEMGLIRSSQEEKHAAEEALARSLR